MMPRREEIIWFEARVAELEGALAAQEARHQEQREVDAAAIRLSLGMLAVEEARHKAEMEAKDAEWIDRARRYFDIDPAGKLAKVLAEHYAPGSVLADVVMHEVWKRNPDVQEAESKLRQERDRCIGIVHSYGVGYPLGDIAAAIRSGEAQPPDKMAMGGSYKVALAAAFEAVKVLADYPPEQETPKPETPIAFPRCAAEHRERSSSPNGGWLVRSCGLLAKHPGRHWAFESKPEISFDVDMRPAAPPAHGGGD